MRASVAPAATTDHCHASSDSSGHQYLQHRVPSASPRCTLVRANDDTTYGTDERTDGRTELRNDETTERRNDGEDALDKQQFFSALILIQDTVSIGVIVQEARDTVAIRIEIPLVAVPSKPVTGQLHTSVVTQSNDTATNACTHVRTCVAVRSKRANRDRPVLKAVTYNVSRYS